MTTKQHILNTLTAGAVGLSSLAMAGTALAVTHSTNGGITQASPSIGQSYSNGNSAVGDTYANGHGSHAGGMSVLLQTGQQAPGGMSHAKIKAAQSALNHRGANLEVNGTFNPDTVQALMDYQKSHNLRVTGHPDHQTLKSLGVL